MRQLRTNRYPLCWLSCSWRIRFSKLLINTEETWIEVFSTNVCRILRSYWVCPTNRVSCRLLVKEFEHAILLKFQIIMISRKARIVQTQNTELPFIHAWTYCIHEFHIVSWELSLKDMVSIGCRYKEILKGYYCSVFTVEARKYKQASLSETVISRNRRLDLLYSDFKCWQNSYKQSLHRQMMFTAYQGLNCCTFYIGKF